MRTPRFRFTMRRVLALLAVSALAGGAAWSWHATRNRITVVNRSGQEIALVMVAVTGSPSCAKFERLPDGGEASATFSVGQDGSFYIHGRFWGKADYGAEFGGSSYGYVTPRPGVARARFVIEPGGKVVFSER